MRVVGQNTFPCQSLAFLTMLDLYEFADRYRVSTTLSTRVPYIYCRSGRIFAALCGRLRFELIADSVTEKKLSQIAEIGIACWLDEDVDDGRMVGVFELEQLETVAQILGALGTDGKMIRKPSLPRPPAPEIRRCKVCKQPCSPGGHPSCNVSLAYQDLELELEVERKEWAARRKAEKLAAKELREQKKAGQQRGDSIDAL